MIKWMERPITIQLSWAAIVCSDDDSVLADVMWRSGRILFATLAALRRCRSRTGKPRTSPVTNANEVTPLVRNSGPDVNNELGFSLWCWSLPGENPGDYRNVQHLPHDQDIRWKVCSANIVLDGATDLKWSEDGRYDLIGNFPSAARFGSERHHHVMQSEQRQQNESGSAKFPFKVKWFPLHSIGTFLSCARTVMSRLSISFL